MRIEIDRTQTGFRLTFPKGEREFIRYDEGLGQWWARQYATIALNIACNLYGANRKAVRFIH